MDKWHSVFHLRSTWLQHQLFLPSAYAFGISRNCAVFDAPHVGFARLLQDPLGSLQGYEGSHVIFGRVHPARFCRCKLALLKVESLCR